HIIWEGNSLPIRGAGRYAKGLTVYTMGMVTTKRLFLVQLLILLGGTVFAWSNLLPQISRFQALYGTLFRFKDCVVPNPFSTACFFGSFAFLFAVLWAFDIYRRPGLTRERHLRNFLFICVTFATAVIVYEAAQYHHLVGNALSFSCNPGASPFATPCFYGDLVFVLAFIVAVVTTKRIAQPAA
ncbi:MAG: hypothetical protein KGH79_05015, partial [Patescibacteria group bacterium]|nr:hypothetical protein [Patescibacteria group bacterium]